MKTLKKPIVLRLQTTVGVSFGVSFGLQLFYITALEGEMSMNET